MSSSPPRGPEDPKDDVGAQAEAERYFVVRAARATRGRAKTIFAAAGKRSSPRPEDRLDAAEK
jgi:hypothetical protein